MAPKMRNMKRNLAFCVIILTILFYALPPTFIALAKPDDSNLQLVIVQQDKEANNQENNNGNIGKGQYKSKVENGQNSGNDNKNNGPKAGNGNPNQGNNNQGNPGNNGAGTNKQPGNNGNGNGNPGNGNPGNASADNGNNKGSDNLNADKEDRGVADTANSIMDAIGRGTKNAAEVLKAIPAKIVPTAIEAAEHLGATLAEKLEGIANFIKGIFGTASPAMVSENTGVSKE